METKIIPPTIGRIVHVVIKTSRGLWVERAAMITRTLGKDCPVIQCTVFCDPVTDRELLVSKSELPYNGKPCWKTVQTPDTYAESWHWPGDNHYDASGNAITPDGYHNGEFVGQN